MHRVLAHDLIEAWRVRRWLARLNTNIDINTDINTDMHEPEVRVVWRQ